MTKINRRETEKRETNSLYDKTAESADPSSASKKRQETEPRVITIKRTPHESGPEKKTAGELPVRSDAGSVGKPSVKAKKKPEKKSAAKSAGESAAKPEKKSAAKSAGEPAAKPEKKSAAKSAGEPAAKPEEILAARYMTKPVERTAPRPEHKPEVKAEAEPVRPRKKHRKKRSKKPLIITLIVIVVFLIGIYIAGIFMWQDKFLPNTIINAQNVGNKGVAEAEDLLLPHNTDFMVTELEGEESIPLSSFDYQLSFAQPIDGLIEAQNRFKWPLAYFQKNEIDNAVTISYDADLLEQEMKKMNAFDETKIIDPKDAYVDKDTDGHYKLFPEVMGNRPDPKKALRLLKEAVEGGSYEADFVDADCYLKPEIYSDDKELNDQLAFIQAIGEETITIDLTGATEVLEPMDLMEFVTLDEEQNIIVNEEVLTNYVNELANKYNTYLNERQFKSHTGEVITVGGNYTEDFGIDTYGFLMNRDATTNILRGCIVSKQDQYMTPAWDVPALTRDDVNEDIGDTYLELSLNEQHFWYYVDGKMVFDADVVTGLDTDERRTPWGVFRAYEKDKDCTLQGEMAGERWNAPVSFWISVTWTGCGIHDASWQPMFGGDYYKVGGSHGCINVSYDTAKYLYENLEVDTPIIIY